MKRVVILWAILGLCAATAGRAQDAATEERLNKLNGRIDDLSAQVELQRQENERLKQAIASLQEQVNRPTPTYATLEYVKSLAEAIKKIDQSRLEDNEKTRAELKTRADVLAKAIAAIAATPPPVVPIIHHTPPPADPTPVTPPPRDDTGFWYKVERDDTLSAIVQACREKNIKVTKEQIIKANAKLKAGGGLIAGNKIWIPVEKP